MANQENKVISQNVYGATAIIVTETTVTLTEQDIVGAISQLTYKKLQIKQQIQQLSAQYNSIEAEIAKNNDLLAQFETMAMPQ